MKSAVGKLTALAYGLCNAIADNTMVLCGVPLKQRQDMLLNNDKFRDARQEIIAGMIKEAKKLLEAK